MPISVTCSQCGSSFRVKDHLAGRRAKCPRCGGVIQVPASTQQASASQAAVPETAEPAPGPAAGLYEALDKLEQQSPVPASGTVSPAMAPPGAGTFPGAAPAPGAPGPAAPYAAGGFPGTAPQRRPGVPAWVWIAGGAGLLVVLCLVGGIFLLSAARRTGLAKREAEKMQDEHGEFGTGTTVRLGGEKVSEEEARALAQKLIPIIQTARGMQDRMHRLDPLFHLPGFMARTLQTSQVPQENNARFKSTATLTVITLSRFLDMMDGIKGTALVRVQQRDGYRSLLLRTIDDDPKDIHYSEVLLVREQGQVKILDMYSHHLGMYLSTLTRWELLLSPGVEKPEDTLVRMPADRLALIAKHRDVLRELFGFPYAFRYSLLKEEYEALPSEVKKWQLTRFGLLRAAAEDSNAEPFPRVAAQFQKQFPDHPVLLFASLKYYTNFQREAPEKACQVLRELAQEFDDPSLLLVQGRYALKKKLPDEALAGFQAALEQLNRPEEQNQARIGLAQSHLLKKDYPRLLEMMTQLRKHDRRPWNEIENRIKAVGFSEFYAFQRTDEYKQWKEQHLGGSGGNR